MTAADRRVAIGVDVGGTKVAIGVVGDDGSLGAVERIATRGGDPGALLETIADRCRALADRVEPAGVGLALPEVLDLDGEVHSHVSLPWTRAQIFDAFGAIAPLALDADVRAAALAEARIGAGRGHDVVGYVSVGTGVSAALVLGGRPYAGAHGAAQLLGSAEMPTVCPRCGRSIRTPALEDLAGGPSLVRTYNEKTDASIGTGEELFRLATGGDDAAREVVRRGAELLGGYLALFVNVVDPGVVVVGGGLGTALDDAWPALVASARDHIWAVHVREVPIVRAELGGDAGVVGAGLLALDVEGA